MNKYHVTLYRSRWDCSTWGIVSLSAACCFLSLIFYDDGLTPLFVCISVFIGLIIILLSVYYRIDDKYLMVYQFFIHKAYPLDQISEISHSKTYLCAPATSLTHRIAIKFADDSTHKSALPLVISPVRQIQFIAQLRAANPDIKIIN